MRKKLDFVSNSSSSCTIVAMSDHHDRSTWHENSLVVYRDTGKIQMTFDDFSHSGMWDSLHSNWAFVCTQVIYWVIPQIVDGTSETKRLLLRKLYNSPDFIRLEKEVIEYLKSIGVECKGIELDRDEIASHKEDGSSWRILRNLCAIDHESIFDGFDDMLKRAKCKSIAELIWGVKQIKITF